MSSQSTGKASSGMPIWLPIAGIAIAVLVFALVALKTSQQAPVGVTAPAGASPNRMPDEGDVLRAQQKGPK